MPDMPKSYENSRVPNPEIETKDEKNKSRGEKTFEIVHAKMLEEEKLKDEIARKEQYLAALLAEQAERFPELKTQPTKKAEATQTPPTKVAPAKPPVVAKQPQPKFVETPNKTTSDDDLPPGWDELLKHKMSSSGSNVRTNAGAKINTKSKDNAEVNINLARPQASGSSPKVQTSPESKSKPSVEQAKNTYNKAKKKLNFRQAIAPIVAAILAASIAVGGFSLLHSNRESRKNWLRNAPRHQETTLVYTPNENDDNSVVDGADDIYLSNGDVATWSSGENQTLATTEAEDNQPIFTNGYQSQPPFIENYQAPDHISNQADQSPERQANDKPTVKQRLSEMLGPIDYSKGIVDGYDIDGLWNHKEDKPSDIAFASAKKLSEMLGGDEKAATRFVAAHQVESLANYLAAMTGDIKPSQFKDLTMLQINQALESDKSFYADSGNWFDNAMKQAHKRYKVIDGRVANAYMMLKDGNGPVNHDNMELAKCESEEYNLEVTEFYWLDDDGKEIGSLLVKMIPIRDAEGKIIGHNGCMQAITPIGGHIYDGLPDITPTPTHDSTIPVTINEIIKPKDTENLKRIDRQIAEDIAEDIGTEKIVITPTPEVSKEDLTDQPTSSDYEDIEPDIVQNQPSTEAEPVTPSNPANNYSENLGGENQNEYSPVQADEIGRAIADANETPIEEAPTGGTELADILADLGIAQQIKE